MKLSSFQVVTDEPSACNANVCGFFIIKICGRARGVNPQSHNFRHFITRRSSFVCCFNLWMQENQYSTLYSVHCQPLVVIQLEKQKGNVENSPLKKLFRDEIMKNSNRNTKNDLLKIFMAVWVERMKIVMNIFAFADSHESPPRGFWNNKLAGVSMS